MNNGTALVNTQGAVRKTNGCTDTDNNNNDFDVVTAPVPRKSSSPVVLCTSASPSLTIASYSAFSNTTVGSTSTSQAANLSAVDKQAWDTEMGHMTKARCMTEPRCTHRGLIWPLRVCPLCHWLVACSQ